MATEGCQFGQEQIYLNVTRVSLAQLPGGDVERVCLWLLCPLTYVPHAPQTIADSSISLSVCLQQQPGEAARNEKQPNLPLSDNHFKETCIHTVQAHIKHLQSCIHRHLSSLSLLNREMQN